MVIICMLVGCYDLVVSLKFSLQSPIESLVVIRFMIYLHDSLSLNARVIHDRGVNLAC